MVDVAVWHPDALIDEEQYRRHLSEALGVVSRTERADVMLALVIDADRPLIEVVCVRPPGARRAQLVASIAHVEEGGVFPTCPPATTLVELGWEHVVAGRIGAWVAGPARALEPDLDALTGLLVRTLVAFGTPLGFVDLRLQRLGHPLSVRR